MIADLWYKNAFIYSLDLDSFMDGNGDGHGDFEGLNRRLEYLDSLGIDTIWVAPFQPSPNRDNGYDVSDFYGVDPRHGSSGDFVEFVQRAKARGINVIIDLVVNHTSDRHPWFRAARSDAGSPYRDWYIWSRKKPPRSTEGMVFPGSQKSVWTFDAKAKEYYYHRFYHHQPDLNMDNPEVRREVRRIMGYWIELGVAGFRVDAVPFILEPSRSGGRGNKALRFEYLAELREMLEWRSAGTIMLGEANVLPAETLPYFGEGGRGLHMMFNFFVNQHLFLTLATGDARPLTKALRATRRIPGSAQWAHFLRNHDELDLGRLTEEDRDTVYRHFAPDPAMRLYDRGIRRRLAPMLGDRRRIELAYSVLFALPGAQVIRYGDEIGMGENLSLKERDAVRTPMQWSDERHAGFSAASRLRNPVITEGLYGCAQVNVENERRDPASLLNWMVRMVRLRKECPEIGWGEFEILDAACPAVLALCYSWQGRNLLVLHNFDERPHEARLRIPKAGKDWLANLLVNEECRARVNGEYRIAIDGYGYQWYRVGGFGYGLRPSTSPAEAHTGERKAGRTRREKTSMKSR
jgi:maltose alpha-D-glucosyltransferase/alpha-amylase